MASSLFNPSALGSQPTPWWKHGAFGGADVPADQQPGAQQQGGSFFDTGKLHGKDWLGLILGAIGDTFAQRNGGQAMVTPLVMDGIISARRAQKDAQQRQQVVQALTAKGVPADQAAILASDPAETTKILGSQYEYHAPQQPDELTRMMTAAGIDPTSDQGKQLYNQAAINKANPAQMQADPATGAIHWVRPDLTGPQPVQINQDDWDKGIPVGGPTQPASGAFR